MSIIIHHNNNLKCTSVVMSDGVSLDAFKTLVRRALNVWPDAPAEIKEFGDMLLEGHLLQDYQSQNQPMKKFYEPNLPYLTDEVLVLCKDCGGKGYHHLHTCPKFGKKG